jgi:hypothetical protein
MLVKDRAILSYAICQEKIQNETTPASLTKRGDIIPGAKYRGGVDYQRMLDRLLEIAIPN